MRESGDVNENQTGSDLSTQSRYARIGTYQEAKLGVCVYLSTVDLCALNVDPESHELIEYQISEIGTDRVLEISGTDSAVNETRTATTTD